MTNVEGQCPFCGSAFAGVEGPKGFGVVHAKKGCGPFEILPPKMFVEAAARRIATLRQHCADQANQARGGL